MVMAEKTIGEILRMSVEDRRAAYTAASIDEVIIDGNKFTGYGVFSFMWEKSYVTSPTRSGDGSIGNLNSYTTFLTPHLKIDFSMMSIDQYRKIMQLLYSKNEFLVTCYDVVYNRKTTNKMYFITEEMPKLWTIARALNGEQWVELLGVQDYTVELVGTNADINQVDILYYDVYGNLIAEATQTVFDGDDVIIRYDYVAPGGYKFNDYWVLENGTKIKNGDSIKAHGNGFAEIKLYADFTITDQYVLSIDYGNGSTLYARDSGEEILEIDIKYAETIRSAFLRQNIVLSSGAILDFPFSGTGSKSVVYKNQAYTPYDFKGWYWTTEPNDNTEVIASTNFNYKHNKTIHQIYSPKKFLVKYNSNNKNIVFNDIYVSYDQQVPLPMPRVDGLTFVGWYIDPKFEEKFSGNMPPKDIDLYGKWVENQ
jgi:hypothetical protein